MAQYEQHSRSASSDESSSGSAGSAYQLILDHILTYPGSYEIPLRSMYALNCAPRAQPGTPKSNTPSSVGSSPNLSQSGWPDTQLTQTFTENLMAQISQLPNQPTSLPPSFITSFVRRCFPVELVCVDFPQALTGLDYLKDLETRRRREVAAAMGRLAIDRTTLDMDAASLSERYPGVVQWVTSIEEKERKIEALYTQLYIVLRRWILINELSLLPFNKHNCVAMLNTLYPPVIATQPTSKLTPATLKAQRDGFFKYITCVEKHGPRMLGKLMEQGRLPSEENGWPSVTRTLGLYLQLANNIISDCANVTDVQDVSPARLSSSKASKKVRKADSGISFTGSDSRRPSTGASSTVDPQSPIEFSRPKTPSGSRAGTTLEKIARGLKTIGRSRTDVTEMIPQALNPPAPATERPKLLRKMRSLSSIGSAASPKQADAPAFNVFEMRLQRQKYEASSGAHQKMGVPQGHEI